MENSGRRVVRAEQQAMQVVRYCVTIRYQLIVV